MSKSQSLYEMVIKAIGAAQYIEANRRAMEESQEQIDALYVEVRRLGVNCFIETSYTRPPYRMVHKGKVLYFESEVEMLVKVAEIVYKHHTT